MRKCRRCGEYLHEPMFAVRADTGKPKSVCRDCQNIENLERYHGNPNTKSAHRKAARRYTLKKYGLTDDSFDALREAQNFECAICETHETETRFGTLNVDHDHDSGTVRGLLCHHCNATLGHLQEQPVSFLRALNYLIERTPKWQQLTNSSAT